MKIMLYGGTFDPPHNGHINNLRAALALVRPDRAIVMPAGTPPHKQASTTPAALRLQMCACFTALSPVLRPGGGAVPLCRQRYAADLYPVVPLAGYAQHGSPCGGKPHRHR